MSPYDKWYASKKGLITTFLKSQGESSLKRGHNPPAYSKEELGTWLTNDPRFGELYFNWIVSGCEKSLKPSIDRLDDNKGYSLDNIQLMTWEQNKQKAHDDMRAGKLIHGNNPQKKVTGVHKSTGEVITFSSAHEAMRITGISNKSISRSCKTHYLAGGYKWSV